MTISSTANKAILYGNGVATSFPYRFLVPNQKQLTVIVTDPLGNQTTLLASQYSVSGINSPNGGAVTYPLSGLPLARLWSITILRTLPIVQLTDIVNQNGFYPDVVESAMDYQTMTQQQLSEAQSRSISFPVVDDQTALTPVLPAAAARATKPLIFDSNGNATIGEQAYEEPQSIKDDAKAVAEQLVAGVAPGSGTGTFIANGAGALVRPFQAKMEDALGLDDFDAAGLADDTLALQAAINAAPAGATITGRPGRTYRFTNLVSTKPLTLDFNGASLIVNPSQGSLTAGAPAIWFKGSLSGTGYAINTTVGGNVVNTTSAADAGNFAPGDMVQVEDNKFIPPWNEGYGSSSSDVSTGYSGRSEVNRVVSADAGTGIVILENTLRWTYDGTSTAKITKVTNWLSKPKVINIGSMVEVDPGGIWVGADIQQAPHLVKFDYCDSPSVDRIHADGWQLHVVNFDHCHNPQAGIITCMDPFRPINGGHGYAVRFNRCHGGTAGPGVISKGARHTVDFCQAYAGISRGNTAFFPVNMAFYCHGLGAKDCKSIDDTVYTRSDQVLQGSGWGSGNPTFAADYRYTVIRPKFSGAGQAVSLGYHSEDTSIVDPDFRIVKNNGALSLRAVFVTSGAKRTRIRGGTIDMSLALGGSSNCAIMARMSPNGSDTFVDPPIDLEIDGTELIGSPGDGATESDIVTVAALSGVLNFRPKRITGSTAFDNGVTVQSTTLAALEVSNIGFAGTLKRGINVLVAPSGTYDVIGNRREGATFASTYMALATSTNLLSLNNTSQQIFNAPVYIDGVAGTVHDLAFSNSTTPRHILRGCDASNNAAWLTRDASGNLLATAWTILNATGEMQIPLLHHTGSQLGFYGNNTIPQPAVGGSRGGNVALASLLSQLAALGLIADLTSA